MFTIRKGRALHLQAIGHLTLLLAIPVLIGLSMWLVVLHAERRSRLVEHTLLVELSVERLIADLKTTGSNHRGYLLTQQNSFLAAYAVASRDTLAELTRLTSLTADSPAQQQLLRQISPLIQQRLARLEALQAREQLHPIDPQTQKATTAEDSDQVGIILSLVDRLYREEEVLLASRELALTRAIRLLYWSLFLGYALIVGIVYSLYRSVKRYGTESAETRTSLAQLNAELDQRIHERTAQLRESEETIRTLLDTASQAILATGEDGAIVLANRMVSAMFGYTPAELLGQPQSILLPADLQESQAAPGPDILQVAPAHPADNAIQLIGRRKDGSTFPVEVSRSSVHSRQGRLAVSFVSDITARKQAENLLRDREQQLSDLAGRLITAQEEERRNLARELHDDVTQQLAFLSIELGRLISELPANLQDARAHVQNLQNQMVRASTEVRRISHGLHPSVITDFGLSVALEAFCEEFERVHTVPVLFKGLIEDSKLDVISATCLYRIAQESVHNAVSHGHASQVRVTLSLTSGFIQLRVSDNGHGFATDASRGKTGLGIVSMKERIRLVNGILRISSRPGHGTHITALVPLAGEHHDATPDSAG